MEKTVETAAESGAGMGSKLAPGWKITLIQIWLGIVVNLGSISAGASLGFSAVALPAMKAPNSTLPITDEEGSWIAGVAALSTPVGCLLSGWIMDNLGRRPALLWLNVPAVIGWAVIAIPGGLPQVFVGRILTGLATGMGSVPGTVYAAEIATKELRGLLTTWTSIAISMGILLVYIMGAALPSWRQVSALCIVFPVACMLLAFFFVPESPAWLIGRGRPSDAERSLMRIRLSPNNPEGVHNELSLLVNNHQSARSRQASGSSRGFRELLHDLSLPECWKPLFIMNGFFFFQQFTGVFVIIFYAVDIVIEAGVEFDPYIVTVLIGLARLGVTLAAGFMSSKMGRRPMSIASGVGMTVCMILLAVHLYLSESGKEFAGSWLPVVTLIGFILSSTLGFLTLAWAMLGEVFPARIRGAAAGFTTFTAYIYSFIIVKVYPAMAHSMERHGVFFFYGVMSFLATLFVIFFLPETQGKTLQEVEQYFSRRPKVKETNNEDETHKLESSKDHIDIHPENKC